MAGNGPPEGGWVGNGPLSSGRLPVFFRFSSGFSATAEAGTNNQTTNNPKKTEAFNLRGFDVNVVDQVPIVPPVNEHNSRYLETKRDKMGHELPDLGN